MTSPMLGHRTFRPTTADKTSRALMGWAGSLPASMARTLVGKARVVDGQVLDPQFQLGLKAMSLVPGLEYEKIPIDQARVKLEREAFISSGQPVTGPIAHEHVIPLEGVELDARMYSPTATDKEYPALVYFHGGGWALGSIDSHDATCRYLCQEAQLKVLSVDYRMAPEFPFPTPVEDAVAAFRFVRDNAGMLGIDPTRIAVGGDSAGGNLAAVVCQQIAASHEPGPDFQLLLVPATNMSERTRSFELFGRGYSLTGANIDFYERTYLRSDNDRLDVRASPLLADDLSGLPPAHVAVAGFDPLRDEGEQYARKLAAAGVPVSLRRHTSLIHPFSNAVGASPMARTALSEAVGALRMSLAY